MTRQPPDPAAALASVRVAGQLGAAGPVPSARRAVRGSVATGAWRAQRALETVEKVLTNKFVQSL